MVGLGNLPAKTESWWTGTETEGQYELGGNSEYNIFKQLSVTGDLKLSGQQKDVYPYNSYIRSQIDKAIFDISNANSFTLDHLSITDSKNLDINLTNNLNNMIGGVIQHITGNGNININLLDTLFQNNSAEYGGVIGLDNLGTVTYEININNSTFESNWAEKSGGVFYNINSSNNPSTELYINNSDFKGNSVISKEVEEYAQDLLNGEDVYKDDYDFERLLKNDGLPLYGQSGGVLFVIGKTTIKNSNFQNNSVSEYGSYSLDRLLGYPSTVWGGSGGAIYSEGELTIINSNFSGNTTGISDNGGAIYSTGILNLNATEGAATGFYGIYVYRPGIPGSPGTSGIAPEDIQLAYYSIDGINWYKDKNFTQHVNIGDVASYPGLIHLLSISDSVNANTVNINNAENMTGTVYLNSHYYANTTNLNNGTLKIGEIGAFHSSTFNLNKGTFDIANGKTDDISVETLTSTDEASIKIDVDLTKLAPVPDTITTGASSSGTVTISDINFNGELKEFNTQILKAQNDNIQLGLSDELKEKYNKTTEETITSTDTVTPTVNWKDTFNKYEQTNTTTTGLELSTTNTTNDSIEFSTKTTEGEKTVTGTMGATLALVNQLQTTEERNFNFDTAEDKYTVNSDLGQTTAGKLNINGVKSENSSSTVDLNGNKGFELANKSTLVVNNTKLTGSDNLITVTNSDAVVELNNAYIDGNINGDKNYNININGADTTTINGNVTSANTHY